MASNRYLNKQELELFNKMNPIFSPDQMEIINQKTPTEEIEIKEENGKRFKSVKASYVERLLTVVTGGQYNFEIKKQIVTKGSEIMTEGRLTIYSNGRVFFRDQCGSYRGQVCADGYKASATDCEKKCASKFGFCWDIYTQEIEILPQEKEISYQEQKIIERLKISLERCNNNESLDSEWQIFESNNDNILEIHKSLYEENFSRINKIS